MNRTTIAAFLCAAAIGFTAIAATPGDTPTTDKKHRFDYLVRDAFFAGFSGDTAALTRGLQLCADTLRANPNHPEALVWHGSGIWFLSGQMFQSGNTQLGMALADSGQREMDKGVKLAPDHIGTIIPRGASLLASAPYIPGPYGKMLLQKGVGDYQHALDLQKDHLQQMSAHARGELIGGLAEGYKAMGNEEKARTYLTMLTTENKGSEYASRAAKWLKLKSLSDKSVKLEPVSCVGCHAE